MFSAVLIAGLATLMCLWFLLVDQVSVSAGRRRGEDPKRSRYTTFAIAVIVVSLVVAAMSIRWSSQQRGNDDVAGVDAGDPAVQGTEPPPTQAETGRELIELSGIPEGFVPPERATRIAGSGRILAKPDGSAKACWGTFDLTPEVPDCKGLAVVDVPEALLTPVEVDGFSEALLSYELERIDRTDQWSVVTTGPYAARSAEPVPLPNDCAVEGSFTQEGAERLGRYANNLLPSLQGGTVLVDDVLVLQVVGDPTPHREALADLVGVCVVEVANPLSLQLKAQTALYQADMSLDSGPGIGGRLDVAVAFVDGETLDRLSADSGCAHCLRVIPEFEVLN
jgi:hypothetical protein